MTKSNKREKARQEQAQKAQDAPAVPVKEEPAPRTIAARNKALATPELLELILLNLDMEFVLLTAQRVSKFWHTAITASAPLQQHLFFKAIPSTPAASPPPIPNPAPREFNPLLYKCFHKLYPHAPVPQTDLWTQRPEVDSSPLPATREGIVSKAFRPKYMDWSVQKEDMLPMADVRNGGARHYAFTRKGASWRRMLVAQPPLVRIARLGDFERVRVREAEENMEDGKRTRVAGRIPGRFLEAVPKRMVLLKEGLKMGDFLDELWGIEFGREYPVSDGVAWFAWRVEEPVRRESWRYPGSAEWAGEYVMPTTVVSKWADGADLVIGGYIPRPNDHVSDSPCSACLGDEGKLRGKRCKAHLMQQQRYRSQEFKVKSLLAVTAN